MKTLTVAAESRKYQIHIGAGAVSMLPEVLTVKHAVIVTDGNIAQMYAARVMELLNDAGIASTLCVIPAGEQNKTLATVERLYHEFAAAEMNRRGVVIALGGGITGDIAGFAAATFMRGVQVVQIPTTIVAQVDSSVGGKTGVNLGEGKNLVGAFHQPSAVIADTDFLHTLPEREWRAGLAEVVKCYALGETAIAPLLAPHPTEENLEQLVALCCRLKARYVAEDERDTGARAALNFGHTFAHAIEKYYDYARYNHGEAVAIGMRLALEAGEKLGVTPTSTVLDVRAAIEQAGLDTSLELSPRELVPLMLGDKKNTSANISLVLLQDLGKPIVYEISPRELEELL
ncbi:MAG: 3-dehydroquinate synthase [Oscillospiraceae bacterium]|jgi:3-dehydroquinate synthase|nr:3-dehydroquinate synthase [Oscillospiraceae bacterium]